MALEITQPTVESLTEAFKCGGGLNEKDAINLIGLILSEDLLKVTVVNGASFVIPAYDSQHFTYIEYGAADDDLISTQVFKKGATVVATLTYLYVGATNNILSITLS